MSDSQMQSISIDPNNVGPVKDVAAHIPSAEWPGTIDLPSAGYLYPDLPGGVVPARPLNTDVEEILVRAAGNAVEIFDTYLGYGLNLPKGMHPRDLLSGDRQYAMFMLRAASLGEMYYYTWTCDQCRKKNNGWQNINELKVRRWDSPVHEPFQLTLPICNDHIEFRLMRGHDEAATERKLDSKEERAQLKKTQLARCIKSINGVPVDPKRFGDVFSYVGRLVQADSNELKLAIEEEDAAIDLTIPIKCGFCLAHDELDLPVTMEFFRPTKRYRRGDPL